MAKKTQPQKIALKGKMTDLLSSLVEEKYGADTTVKTIKGFALEVEGSYIEVSCVVKKDDFDLNEEHTAYLDKIQAAKDRETERLEKKAKREALKKAKSSD